MSNIWLISDLHLGHRLLVDKKIREQGYEYKILNTCKHCIMPNDTLYLLGDVARTRQAFWFDQIQQIPGHKILMLGNHDKNRESWYKKWGFSEVVPFNKFKIIKHQVGKNEMSTPHRTYSINIMLSYIPASRAVLTSRDDRYIGLAEKFETHFKKFNCVLNIHGHLHGEGQELKHTMDISPEVIGYGPKKLEQLLEMEWKR